MLETATQDSDLTEAYAIAHQLRAQKFAAAFTWLARLGSNVTLKRKETGHTGRSPLCECSA